MNRYWTLSDEPVGDWPGPGTFALREAPIPAPGPGQALTRTIYISLDPYQWGYKRRGVEPAGAPCHARTVAQVVESRVPPRPTMRVAQLCSLREHFERVPDFRVRVESYSLSGLLAMVAMVATTRPARKAAS